MWVCVYAYACFGSAVLTRGTQRFKLEIFIGTADPHHVMISYGVLPVDSSTSKEIIRSY